MARRPNHAQIRKEHAVAQNALASSENNGYSPEEKVTNFDGAPAALCRREDDVSATRTQQRIHVGDRTGRGQVS